MPLSYEVVCPWNHLNHATSARAADGITIGVELIKRVKGVDLFIKCLAILSAKSFMVNMLDNAQALRNVQNVWRNCHAAFTESADCQVKHVAYIRLTRVHEIF